MSDGKPIIIIKKKGGHGGHHGGAWKVAFADFMTAMMAFFLVMWLVNSADQPTKEGIAQYFREQGVGAFPSTSSDSLLDGQGGILDQPFSPHNINDFTPLGKKQRPKDGDAEEEEEETIIIDDEQNGFPKFMRGDNPEYAEGDGKGGGPSKEEYKFKALADEIMQRAVKLPELNVTLGKLEVSLEPDGMVIEVMDTDEYSMFESGSAIITDKAKEAFIDVVTLLAPFPNKIDILGHTDAHPYARSATGYSNWELSTDRADAARRLLVKAGISEDRIVGVIGRAARYPRLADNPFAASNRRIAIKMRFLDEQVTSPDSFIADEEQKAEMERKHHLGEGMYYSSEHPSDNPTEEPTGFADDDKPSFDDESDE